MPPLVRWTKEELFKYIEEVKKGTAFDKVPEICQNIRTESAVKGKIALCVYKFINGTPEDLKEVCDLFGVEEKARNAKEVAALLGFKFALIKELYQIQLNYAEKYVDKPMPKIIAPSETTNKTKAKKIDSYKYIDQLSKLTRLALDLENEKLANWINGETLTAYKEDVKALFKKIKPLSMANNNNKEEEVDDENKEDTAATVKFKNPYYNYKKKYYPKKK